MNEAAEGIRVVFDKRPVDFFALCPRAAQQLHQK
jgi:hypothetical protein